MSQPLIARTYLGDNTVAILETLCSHLHEATAIEIRGEPDEPGTSPDASEHAREFDLIWACGLLTRELSASGKLDADIVAAPVFTGESEAVYHSVVVARSASEFGSLAESLSGRLAINEEESWSGHHGLTSHMRHRGLGEFESVVMCGSHRASAEAVAAGTADVAAIDHTVWAHLLESGASLAELEVIDRTVDWPAPPFSLRRSIDHATRTQLIDALTSVGPADIEGLERIDPATAATYATLRRP